MSLNKSSFTKPIQYGILSQCWQNKIVYFNMERKKSSGQQSLAKNRDCHQLMKGALKVEINLV